MSTHLVDRTSPFGGPFIGKCRYCGQENLPANAACWPCPVASDIGITQDDSLLAAIEGANELGDLDDDCPNCGGEGMVWGCFEDTCVCIDDDGLGCSPIRCDYCTPILKPKDTP